MGARLDNMKPAMPAPPFRLMQDDLGLGNESPPRIQFADRTGTIWETEDIEQVLFHIDHFAGRGRISLLAGAALHYGLDVYALMGMDPARVHEEAHKHG